MYLAGRDMASGQLYGTNDSGPWSWQRAIPLMDGDGTTCDRAQAENLLRDASGMELEGVVVVDASQRRVKIKAADYVRLHRLRGQTTTTALLDAICDNDIEEITIAFPHIRGDVATLTEWLASKSREIASKYAEIGDIKAQKEFARVAVGYEHSGALFAIRSGKVETAHDWLLA